MAKILVVEDNLAIRDLLVLLLETKNHDVRCASTGDEAVDVAYTFEPQVAIIDWDLKDDYDGYEVAEACVHANSDMKPIIISGYTDRLDQCPASANVFSTLAKPFSLSRLVESVNAALSSDLLVA